MGAGEGPIPNGGYQAIVQQHFTVNCMKMKKIGPGSARPKFYCVDPPLLKIVKLLCTIFLLPLLQDTSEDVLSVFMKIVINFISEDSLFSIHLAD